MPRTAEEKSVTREFASSYLCGRSDVMRRIELTVCGCDYGGTSWTTRAEADQMAELLGLKPGVRLLEVGAGCGWPGLYMANRSGCDLALVDLPFEGLAIASERALADRLDGNCWLALADAEALPFRNGSFDAVSHSDVLCCLEAKRAVLTACRRVVGAGGKMVFSVISMAPGLASAEKSRAVQFGPPFVNAPTPYREMLGRTGWTITGHWDVTAGYGETVRRLIAEQEDNALELSRELGAGDLAERLTKNRQIVGMIEDGILKRELFATIAAEIDEMGV